MKIADEHLLSPAEATRECPGRPSLRTLWRWMRRGVAGVRLESVVIGGRRYTSREALERYIAARTAAANRTPTTPSSTRRQRAIEDAERELADV